MSCCVKMDSTASLEMLTYEESPRTTQLADRDSSLRRSLLLIIYPHATTCFKAGQCRQDDDLEEAGGRRHFADFSDQGVPSKRTEMIHTLHVVPLGMDSRENTTLI